MELAVGTICRTGAEYASIRSMTSSQQHCASDKKAIKKRRDVRPDTRRASLDSAAIRIAYLTALFSFITPVTVALIGKL